MRACSSTLVVLFAALLANLNIVDSAEGVRSLPMHEVTVLSEQAVGHSTPKMTASARRLQHVDGVQEDRAFAKWLATEDDERQGEDSWEEEGISADDKAAMLKKAQHASTEAGQKHSNARNRQAASSHEHPEALVHESSSVGKIDASRNSLNKAAFVPLKEDTLTPPANPPPAPIAQPTAQPTVALDEAQVYRAIHDPHRKKVEVAEKVSWWKNEQQYVEVESLILVILGIMALCYMLVFWLFRMWFSSKPDHSIKEKYGETARAVRYLEFVAPTPRGAAASYTSLLNTFSHQVMVLVFMMFTVWAASQAGDFSFMATQFREHGVDIHELGAQEIMSNIFMQLFVSLILLVIMNAFTVGTTLSFQRRLMDEHIAAEAEEKKAQEEGRMQDESDYHKLRCLLVDAIDDSSVVGDKKNFQFARYFAVSADRIVDELVDFKIWSWIFLGVFEFFMYLGVHNADAGSDTDTSVQVFIAITGPLIVFLLLGWVYQRESFILKIAKELTEEKTLKETQPDLIYRNASQSLPDKFYLTLLQAAAFFTCYSVARVIAAKRTYYGGYDGNSTPGYEVVLVITAFILLYIFAVFTTACVVVRSITVLTMPSHLDKKNVKLVKQIAKTTGPTAQETADIKHAALILGMHEADLQEKIRHAYIQNWRETEASETEASASDPDEFAGPDELR